MVRVVDEKRRLLELLFPAEFTQKQHGELCRSRLNQPDLEEFARLEIHGGVQPVALVIHLIHCLLKRDVIRLDVALGL